MKPSIPKIVARFTGVALFAAAAVCTVRADYISTLLSHNPLAYWRLNDGTVSPPLNVITNAGSLGSAATGYVVNNGVTSPILGQPGNIGTSVRFQNPGNTVGLCASKIEVPWIAALNSQPPFSIEFWAKPNSLGADGTGFSPLENFNPSYFGGGNRSGWLFYVNNNGRWNFRLGSHSGYALSLLGTSGNATVGNWQHIAVTWDGATCKMYANGALIGSGAVVVNGSIPWYNNPVSFIRMGGSPLVGNNNSENANSGTSTIGNRGYDGWLQHVALYNTVLTPSQINAHYSAASTNNSGYVAQVQADGPLAYWPMNDAPQAAPSAPFPASANSGSLGSAADATNYPGILVGQAGPGYGGFGTDNNALFDDGVNGYALVDDAAGLHFNGQITLAAWVKPMEQDYFRDIIAHGYDANTAETFLRMSRGPFWSGDFANYNVDSTGDGQYYEMGSSDGANYYDAAQAPVPPGDIGNWVFIAGTYDGANWNLYRNGQLVATTPNNGDGFDLGAATVTGPWTIGSRQPDGVFQGQTESFGGSIFQPAIFNTALSAGDINALYLAAQVPPVITQAPVNPGLTFKNSTVNFTVVADGAPTLGYLWITNGISTGDTTTSFTIPSIQTGSYTVGVIVTNAYGTNTPQVSFNVVPAPPVITQSPTPQSRYVGYPFTLSVTAGGTTPLSYYWYLGSTLVQAGSSSNYTAVASLGNAGSYSVVVSNETSITVTSSPANVAVSTVPSGYPAAVIANSPQSYYRMDETSGTTIYDVVGGNNGNYHSIPPTTLGVPGYSVLDPDTAVSFSGVNSYAGDISGTAINFANNHNFTLEAWVNAPAGQPDQATIIAKGIGNNGTTETEQFALDVSGGSYRFFTTRNGTVYPANAVTGPNGTWQHIVGIYDAQNALGGGSKLYIYINGTLEGSGPCPINNSAATSPVSIGSKRTGNDPNYDGTFGGTIDEVAVYPTALSGSTVFNHYAAAYGTTLAPFINVQPVATTNYAGLPVTLSVVAAGSVTLHYQWFQGNTPVGIDSDAYTVQSLSAGDQGFYHVNISNNIGNTNSTTNFLAVLPAPTSPPAIPGLVMHLPFNNNLNDVTGRGNNGSGLHSTYNPGTSTGTTNPVSPGANSGANPKFYYTDGPFPGTNGLHFSTFADTNAVKGQDDWYVKIGTKPDLQFGSNINFSVAFWIRTPLGYGEGPDFGGGGDLPFFTTALQSLGGFGFDFATPYAFGTQGTGAVADQNAAGSWCNSFYGGSSTGVALMGSIGQINDGNWHSLVYVINRKSGIQTTYLDGVPVQSFLERGTKLADAGNIDSGNSATVGQDPTGVYGELGQADIADLGVWRKALTPLEAASIYAAGIDSGLSYGYVPTTFTSSFGGGNVTLTWNLGTLQSATSPAGPWTAVPNAVSPYTASTGSGNLFYRISYTYQ